ncbi:MAG: flagellar biosynthesis protein FlhB [Bdellovibrionaceae bacterium]|nr:flagellar biosynthesis protein FlhB [Pseudobdellovibrionaceae bacterium]
MAENQDERSREDLSDEPSQLRIEEMRKKGQVSQSKELTGLVGLLATGGAIYFLIPKMGEKLFSYSEKIFHVDEFAKINLLDQSVLFKILSTALKEGLYLLAPIAVVGFVLTVASSYAQIGSIFSTDPLTPNLEKINPIQGAKRFLSLKQVYEGLRLLFRGSIVALIAYYVMKDVAIQAPSEILNDPAGLPLKFFSVSKEVFFSLIGILFVFAGFDFWLQRWEYGKNTRLTKQEAKQEHKEQEGDPLVRSRIRSAQREMARKRMMNDVKTADVIITNPTHIAIAIRYDRNGMSAPQVVAKGADFLAQKIKKIASENSVPLVENVPLARTLYKNVKVGEAIPHTLYQAVAEVLAYIYKMKNKINEVLS